MSPIPRDPYFVVGQALGVLNNYLDVGQVAEVDLAWRVIRENAGLPMEGERFADYLARRANEEPNLREKVAPPWRDYLAEADARRAGFMP